MDSAGRSGSAGGLSAAACWADPAVAAAAVGDGIVAEQRPEIAWTPSRAGAAARSAEGGEGTETVLGAQWAFAVALAGIPCLSKFNLLFVSQLHHSSAVFLVLPSC